MSREEKLSARMRARDLKKRVQEDRGGRTSAADDGHSAQARRTELRHRIVRLRWLGLGDEAEALERGLNEAFA